MRGRHSRDIHASNPSRPAAPWLASAASHVRGGAYNDAMLLAYDPATGQVNGYFDMARGDQPSFSCSFYLHGRLAGGATTIETYFPATLKSDLIKRKLTLADPQHFMRGDGVRLAETC